MTDGIKDYVLYEINWNSKTSEDKINALKHTLKETIDYVREISNGVSINEIKEELRETTGLVHNHIELINRLEENIHDLVTEKGEMQEVIRKLSKRIGDMEYAKNNF